jgi:hypothetical protein
MKNIISYSSRTTCMVLMLAAATSLSGCMTDQMDAQESMMQPAAYSGPDAYPITVVKGPVTLEVASTEGSLQPMQINAVTSASSRGIACYHQQTIWRWCVSTRCQ